MITYKGENYDIPDSYVISILKRYKFKLKIVKAFAQRTDLTLPDEFIAMCEEANSWAAEFISSDKDEPTEEWLLRLERYFESELNFYYRYGKLKEYPVASFISNEEGVRRMGEDYVYFVTVYELATTTPPLHMPQSIRMMLSALLKRIRKSGRKAGQLTRFCGEVN